MSMSIRLQIILPETEREALRRCAEREGLTLSEWARRALRQAQLAQTGPTRGQKFRALERALGCGHPTGDIAELLSEIESGRDLR